MLRYSLAFSLGFYACQALAHPLLIAPSSLPVLYIGDSISEGAFGHTIDTYLRTRSTAVTTEASCGSAPKNWLASAQQTSGDYQPTVCGFWKKTPASDEIFPSHSNYANPELSTELNAIHPGLVMVQLGTNITSSLNVEAARGSVHDLIAKILGSGSKCIWLGPPDADSVKVPRPLLIATAKMIQEEAQKQKCDFVDLLKFTKFIKTGTSDGIHPDTATGTAWANQVIALIKPQIDAAL